MSPKPKPRPGAAEPAVAERVAAQVVALPLLRVGQHLVRGGDLLEPLLRLRVRVDVGVQLAGEPAVGPLDLVRGGVAADAEDVVEVLRHQDSARMRPTYRATARTAAIVAGVVHPGRADHAEPGDGLAPRRSRR